MTVTSRARGPAPLVGVMGCAKFIAPHPYHAAGEKYVTAVAEAAGAIPLVIPPLGAACDAPDVIARLDGLLVTGSPSNVMPALYGGPPSAPGTLHDEARDATALPLIRAALDAACPLFAICRGMQELNVVHGGTLHQKVHEVPGRDDHRADTGQPLDAQYGPAHPVRLEPGGVIADLAGTDKIIVNSIHSQGIDRLGGGLAVEAVATDGQIEAVRVSGAAAFALGVQWHPEWRFEDDPVSTALFEAFGAACRDRAQAMAPT
jgi:putative glutamine amidotransferase